MDGAQMKAESEEKKEEDVVHLRRQIGLLPAISIIIGTVVGSGIFIAPKGVLMNSGSVGLSLLVWLLAGLLSMFGALCYAELGTTFTKSGAHYTYLLETLGPLPAFLRLWVEFLFIRPAVTSYVCLAFARYVVEPVYAPCEAPAVLIKIVGILSITFVVVVNCWSVSMSSRIQVVLTFVKVFALVLIIVPGMIALTKGKTDNFQKGFELESLTLGRLPLAFYNGLYAYAGWFYLNFVTEEVINPNSGGHSGSSSSICPLLPLLSNLQTSCPPSPPPSISSVAFLSTFCLAVPTSQHLHLPMYCLSLSLLCTCPNHLHPASLTWSPKHLSTCAVPLILSSSCSLPERSSASSSLLPPALPPVFSSVPLFPNHTTLLASPSFWTLSLSSLLTPFCHTSHLTLFSNDSILPAPASSPLSHTIHGPGQLSLSTSNPPPSLSLHPVTSPVHLAPSHSHTWIPSYCS
ncbi:large neutral amino acids transporter small subunit 1 isoform 2-T2 [Synchiropus picturatus]